MRNTGIEYTSAERTPTILPDLAELLPPLSGEQLAALEKDILQNGCYAPIIVNEDLVVVDGHNRQQICTRHDLPYKMAVFAFDDLLEAKQWALDTQKGRRNLDKWELGKIAGVFCKAYEKAVLLTPTEENVRIWVKCTRMTREEMEDTIKESRELAGVFTSIAGLMEHLLPERGTL